MDFQNNFKQYLSNHSDKSQAETDDLKNKEMRDLMEAINNSKDTAKSENEKREYQRQEAVIQTSFYKSNASTASSEDIFDDVVKEKAFTPKRWNKQPKSPVDITKVQKEILPSEPEFELTFQDLLEASGKQLDIVYHNPVFDLPLTINPEYKKYSMKQRAKLLYHYFTKVDLIRSRLAKESFFRAPYPKPILPSNKCKTSLCKNGADEDSGSFDEFVDKLPVQDLYVSRAGRQIKRKIYTEETEFDSDPDFAYSNKKNKSDDSDTKITLDTPFIADENHSEEKVTPKLVKTRKDTPRRPLPLSMKRYANRAELLFDKVMEDVEKKKQQEEEMDIFEKTLPKVDDTQEEKWVFDDSPVKEVPDDILVRKRVPPPNPAKKGGRPRKITKPEASDKNETKTESPPGSPLLKRYATVAKTSETKSKPRARMPRKDSQPEEVSVSKLEKTACPICNREFLQSEIVNHASNCGIDDEPVEEPVRTIATKTISCSLCEREFAMNTEYEVHVKQCIAAKVIDM